MSSGVRPWQGFLRYKKVQPDLSGEGIDLVAEVGRVAGGLHKLRGALGLEIERFF